MRQTNRQARQFQCTDGRSHPLKYKGKLIWLNAKEPTELDWGLVPHMSKIHIDIAIKNNEMVEVTAWPEASAEEQGDCK